MWFSITNKNDFLEVCKGLNKASIAQMDPTRVTKKNQKVDEDFNHCITELTGDEREEKEVKS